MVEDNGKLRKAEDVTLVDKIMELKSRGDPWVVIDELLKVWSERTPDEVKAVQIDVEEQREMLIDKKFGTTKEGGAMERRFKMLFPSNLSLMIRTIYKAEELPFDKVFYAEFAKRYPFFKIASSN